MRITVQVTGDHSAALAALRPGTRVLAEGPFGAFTPARTGRSVLLLAGGVGITPLRAMFAALSGPVTLIYRASTWQDIVFQSELDAIAEARGATIHYVVGSRREFGADPLSATALRQLAPGLHRMDVYLCGPPGMTGSAVAALTEAGVPRRRERAVTGNVANTAYGPVQVQVVVATSKIVKVNILERPESTSRDLQIGQFAFPRLISETLSAQSARIDSVSGATYTSGGYIQSLQSALDNGA